MIDRSILTAALACSVFAPVSAQDYHQAWWAGGNSGTEVSSVKITSQGRILAVMVAQDSAVFMGDALPYPVHLYLTSISPLGDVEWTQPVGAHVWGFNFERTGMVLDDDDNIYLAAAYTVDTHVGDTTLTSPAGISTFIAKFNSAGERVWVKHVASGLLTRGIDRNANGELVIGGCTQGLQLVIGSDTVPVLGNQSTDIVLVKLNEDGDVLWYDRSGGPGWYSDNSADVCFDASGNIVMTGWIRSDSWFDSIPLEDWYETGGFNGFVAGYSPSGTAQWVTRLGYEPHGIAADAFGNTFAVGYDNLWHPELLISGIPDGRHYLARLNSAGTVQWIVQPGDMNHGNANDIVTDDAGYCWVTGHHRDSLVLGPFTEHADGLQAFMVYRADANGSIEWMDLQGNVGTMGDFRAMAIAHDDSCGLVIGGSRRLSDPWSLGTASLPPAPHMSGFILSMDDCSIAMSAASSPSSDDLSVHPNPADDRIRIRSSHGAIRSVEAFDLLGRPVEAPLQAGGPGYEMDISHLPPGTYVLRVRTNLRSDTRIILVE